MLSYGVSNEGVCQIFKPDSSRNRRKITQKFEVLLLLFVFLMSQTSYNLVTLVPIMLVPCSGRVSTGLRPRHIGFLCYCTQL